MKKIIITGASGFIGGFLVEKALELDFKTWAGVRKNSNRDYLQDDRISFIDLNFGNKKELTEQLKDFKKSIGHIDYIIHNAGVTKCIDNNDFERINYQYTVNLIDALKEADCVPDKFVLMSSLSAYGLGDEISYTPIKATDIPHPNTMYGISKLRAEQYLEKTTDFPYIILRPTGVYGPREKDYYLMLKTIKSGLDVGAGFKPQHLTFIYVKDLVCTAFKALESQLTGKAYFVADGDVYTDEQYTALIKNLLGKKHVVRIKVPLCLLKIISVMSENISKITKKPSTLNGDKYKIMKQRNWECDIEPLRKDMQFVPQYNLKKGLQESIEWYKNNGWL